MSLPIGPTQPPLVLADGDLQPILAGVVELDDEVGRLEPDAGPWVRRHQGTAAVAVGRVLPGEARG